MAYHSSMSFDAELEDLPFPISPSLLSSSLVSPNPVETVNNAEQFMVTGDYGTAAALFTLALRHSEVVVPPDLKSAILCKRAKCLLRLNYVQQVLRDCLAAREIIGGENEHIAFLWSHALELQGQVLKAFVNSVIYKFLDPEMKRDKNIVDRLRAKVKSMCGQGFHQVSSTVDMLIQQGKMKLADSLTELALSFFTEVVTLFPIVVEAYELRAQCYFKLGDFFQAKRDCNRALELTNRTSTVAFDIEIRMKIQFEEFDDALKLVNEWQTIDPENVELSAIESDIRAKMATVQSQDIPPCQSEYQQQAQEIEERNKQEDVQDAKGKAVNQRKEEQLTTSYDSPGALRAGHLLPSAAPVKHSAFPERKKRRRIRNKTRTLRAAREADDSDASSVCSISTCPGDLGYATKATCRPKMPTFEESDQGFVSDVPKSSTSPSSKAKGKSPNKETSGIRPRPPGIYTAYRLCKYSDRPELCWQGKLCTYAHSEAERKAWEDDFKKSKRKPTASRKNTRKNKDTGITSTPSKDFRKAVRREEITTKTTRADERPVAVSDESKDSQETAVTSDDWILVSRAAKKSSKGQKDKVRPAPLNFYGTYRLCRHYLARQWCPTGDHCCFAHGETERAAWEEERKKRFRKPTTSKSKSQTAKKKRNKTSVSSALKEWRKEFRGQCRAPLRIPKKGKQYLMCPEWRKGSCKLDRKCTLAHGEKELTAWNEHLKKMEMRMERKKEEETEKAEEKGEESMTSSTINDDKRPATTYKVEDLVPSIPGVNVLCDPPDLDVTLQVPLNSEEETQYSWNLRIHYESNVTGHLRDIVLLPNYHKFYTLSSVKFSCKVPNANGTQRTVEMSDSEEIPDQFHYPVKSSLRHQQGVCDVEIAVSFSTSIFGNFVQFLVLDFGREAHLAVKITVEVGSQEFLQEYSEVKSKLKPDLQLWDDGSREIVKFEPKRSSVFNNEHLIGKYGLPSHTDIIPCPLLNGSQGLSKENYKDVMHQLLFVEEFYIRKQVASYNIQGTNLHASKFVVKRDELLSAQEGWLYGSFHVTRPITPDDADGRLLLRNLFASFGSVLISQSHIPNSMIYEALVESVEESRVILKLPTRFCGDLGLKDSSEITVNIQFQINRLPLCEMHDAIDRLGPQHIRILFPAFSRVVQEEKILPLPWILDPKLNEDQKEIIRRIAAPSSDAPPLVVFGPFGTGKTFALNQAVRRIAVNRNNRVLICTHSNSAADIHVELLDEYLKEQNGISASRPLRIYTPLRKLSTVSTIVKEYCLIADKGEPTEAFRLPARDDVLSHRVIVTTLGMSRALFDMELHRGFFSHILIDEAAQALETETLTPITLAGNDTKVVFTGDHMQMSPDVFSPEAKNWGFQTSLQERLFYEYKQLQAEETFDSNLIFLTENYRSNEQLLQLASDMFYGGKLSAGSNQPLHPSFGPFMFFCALGKEEMEANHFSFRNLAEVSEIVRRVRELADSWPEEWGAKDLKQVAVVSSYHYQVKTIRDALRKNGLGQVDVETIENVQGKQFRALFVSTVRTFHTYKEFHDCEANGDERPYMYFLSDPKLLNTALTRAKSLIVVVGDPFSLRTIGDCQAVWEEFIERCSDMGKLFGVEHNDLEEAISQSGLNINAAVFVPSGSTDIRNSAPSGDEKTNRKPQDVRKTFFTKSSLAPFQSQLDENRGNEISFSVEGKRPETGGRKSTVNDHPNLEDSEPEWTSESDDAGDELTESDDLGNADDFAEYGNVDETVPPKDMDEIILALKAKCEEKALKKKSQDKAKSKENDLKVDDAERNTQCFAERFDSNTSGDRVIHEDYNIRNKGGITKVFLENMTFRYSERTERLIRPPKVKEQESFQPEYVDRLLREQPHLYQQCKLRITKDRRRITYGEIQDNETEDVLIEGNTRQSFDRDTVVIELTNPSFIEEPAPQGYREGLKGKIVCTKNHAINLRERQFVCTIGRGNPKLMCPINGSMTPLAILTDESFNGIPIYKKIPPESGERPVCVERLPLKEALSGKYLFVVQYLQWKRTFPHPLGIVTKKIPRGHNLNYSLNILNFEFMVKENFPDHVVSETKRQVSKWTRIPDYERKSRQPVLNAFTIDPPRSRALDDALTVETLENGTKVGIHIADVSYFVKRGSKVDVEAEKRGTSHYKGHPNGEVLMLPEGLSYDICSLLPNKERLAVSIYIDLDRDGLVQREEQLNFCRTIVRSQCRLSYAEAQRIIMEEPIEARPEVTSEIRQSIKTLSDVAQKRRKVRLADGSFYHFDYADRKEDLEAHELVEEMMILANMSVAKYLIGKKEKLLPLRVQPPPKTRKFNAWRERFGNFAKLSLSLRKHLVQDFDCVENFLVPISTWKYIRKACCKRDYRKLKQLICNDNLYPQLSVARSSLNAVARGAEDVKAADVALNQRRHWSLNVMEYTRFTSPIRRYLDIEVHRLLLEEEGKELQSEDLSELIRRCSFLSEQSSEFQKDFGRVRFAFDLKSAPYRTTAVVNDIGWNFIQLKLLSDADEYYSSNENKVRVSDLGPIEQPIVSDSSSCIELSWKLRLYDASTANMKRASRMKDHQQEHLRQDKMNIEAFLPTELDLSNAAHNIPGFLWFKVLEAVKEDNCMRLSSLLEEVHNRIEIGEDSEERPIVAEGNEYDGHDNDDDYFFENDDDGDDHESDSGSNNEDIDDPKAFSGEEDMVLHFIHTKLTLKVSDVVEVQLSANEMGPLMLPDIQVFELAPSVQLCLEHRKHTDKCFAEVASEKASLARYRSVERYMILWKPLLIMEAATKAVSNDDSLVLQNIKVTWRMDERGKLVGSFQLQKTFAETRKIEIFCGDYACVRVPYQASLSSSFSEIFPHLTDEHHAASSGYSALYNSAHEAKNADNTKSLTRERKSVERYFVCHCVFTKADISLKFTLQLFQSSMKTPEGLMKGETRICTVEVIKQTIPCRRMINTIEDLPKATPLAHDICLGRATRLDVLHIRLPDENLSIADHAEECSFERLNDLQVHAVKKALRNPFTLIQGPPGTGKTITGVHIAYWFARTNKESTPFNRTTPTADIPDKAPPQVLYCGPSNKSVDVVAEYLLRIQGIKIIRAYGNMVEQEEFPIPNQVKPPRPFASQEELRVPEILRTVALHHVIRDRETSPYAGQLKHYENIFAEAKRRKKRVKDEMVQVYLKLIKTAEEWAIRSSHKGEYVQIVLCTCSAAGSKRIKETCNNVFQCIVDECGMCLEPETLIPIVSSKAKQVVLIGDHKQLQPIVTNRVARSLGLRTSMFERFSEHALLLEEQYRMHRDICEFPSFMFYEDKLRTSSSVDDRDKKVKRTKEFLHFWPCHKGKDYVPLVFCHVAGEERELAVTTEQGNQRSKSNLREKDKVVEVVRTLVHSCGVGRDQIVVLSPYRAQCHVIREGLADMELSDVPVISIIKSQGSESDFVIISLVRSLPEAQIDCEPDRRWLSENLGFVTDEHQINVALTRAKQGLCIIGNKNLLNVCELWGHLIYHYENKSCLVDGEGWPRI